jgi:adenylate cyclase
LALGVRDFWRGAFDDAIRGLSEAVACFDPKMLATLPLEYGIDNPLYAHLMLAWAQYLAGRLGDGQATWEEAWSITEAARSPYLSAMALSFGAAIARDLGDADRAIELSGKGVELSSAHQLVFWLALAQMQHGSARCLCQNVAEGIVEIEQGLQLLRLTGVSSPLAYYLCYHADACHRSGAVDKGLASVEEGLNLAQTTVDRVCTPELLRLKGELLIQRGGSNELAEACMRDAVEVARTDGAGLWELRAATSLARVLWRRGETGPATRILEAGCQRIIGGNPLVLRQARELHEQIEAGLEQRVDA